MNPCLVIAPFPAPGKEVFEELFERVFALCVERGMVSGETQCVDSALIKANASLDSLLEKQPAKYPQSNVTLEIIPDPTAENESGPKRPAKFDRSNAEQRIISAPDFELADFKQR